MSIILLNTIALNSSALEAWLLQPGEYVFYVVLCDLTPACVLFSVYFNFSNILTIPFLHE